MAGSHNPANGEPGILYVGGVGWYLREELNIVRAGGENFGWPLFEGLEPNTAYTDEGVVAWPIGSTAPDGSVVLGRALVPRHGLSAAVREHLFSRGLRRSVDQELRLRRKQ